MASDERLSTAAWLGLRAVEVLMGCSRPGIPGRFLTWVSVGQEPAGRAAPVDRAARSAPLRSPGDPALPAPRRRRLAPWDRFLLHRVAPSQLPARGRCGALEQLEARVADLGGQAVQGRLVGHRPVIVVSARSSQLPWRPPNQADQWLS